MACKPGTAGANELASLSRHAPLFTRQPLAYPIRRYGRRAWLVETLSLPRRLGCSVPHLGGSAGNSDAAWSGGVHIVVR